LDGVRVAAIAPTLPPKGAGVDLEATELETPRQAFLDDADQCLTVLDESLGFLSKPWTVAELVSSVQQALTEGEGR
jgi:hypothetical protein